MCLVIQYSYLLKIYEMSKRIPYDVLLQSNYYTFNGWEDRYWINIRKILQASRRKKRKRATLDWLADQHGFCMCFL